MGIVLLSVGAGVRNVFGVLELVLEGIVSLLALERRTSSEVSSSVGRASVLEKGAESELHLESKVAHQVLGSRVRALPILVLVDERKFPHSLLSQVLPG